MGEKVIWTRSFAILYGFLLLLLGLVLFFSVVAEVLQVHAQLFLFFNLFLLRVFWRSVLRQLWWWMDLIYR